MSTISSFHKKNLERLKTLALDCPECIKENIQCRHYDYLKDYIKELEALPPFDDEKFEVFWKAYPVKKAKAYASKIWARLKVNDELFDKIMASLADQKKSDQWVKDYGKFIPHPTTWLNQERWDDEVKVKIESVGKYDNI